MNRRWKTYGAIDDWPWARVWFEDEQYEVQLSETIWPDSIDTLPGTYFSLHFRGDRFLYCYPIVKPRITRSEIKKVRKEVRKMGKWWS